MHLTPICEKVGEKGIKSFSLAGKSAAGHPGPREPRLKNRAGMRGARERKKYYWELIKNDK
jgi:hypothetical protein